MIVTFIYRIAGAKYYGKYIGFLPDEYDEGLDKELSSVIQPAIHAYYQISDPVPIGILSHHRLSRDYFSEDEKEAFDLLYCNWSTHPMEIFFDQKLFIMPKTK